MDMADKTNETIDQILDGFTVNDESASALVQENQYITIRVPESYKAKYELLQRRSGMKFGKLMKEILKKSIDKVSIDAV